MSKTPELSIIVPVYNVEAYIEVCLNSISEQTFTDWECILIDDGSKDWSGFICDNYSKRDDRFKVVHQKNAGVSAARNVGIELATAPYISFIDPDDYISLNYFEDSITELKRNKAALSIGVTRWITEKGIKYPNILGLFEGEIRKDKYRYMRTNATVIEALSINFFSCVCWGKIYKRSLWGEARFPVGIDLGEDMMTVPQVIIKAKSAVSVPSATYFYRQRERSLLHGTVTRERFNKDLAASAIMREQLASVSPENKEDFGFLKLFYDIGCCANYVKSGSDEPHGSVLGELQKAYEKSGERDLWEALREYLQKETVNNER